METLMRPPRTMAEVYHYLPQGTPVQLINNQLIMSPAPKDVHQKVLNKINRLLSDFIEKNHLGETRIAPSDVYLNDQNIYQPDIYFVSSGSLKNFQEDGFHGAPDLIVEILSPGSENVDRLDKKKNYEIANVKEYWIVEPREKKVTGFSLNEGKLEEIFAGIAKIESPLLQANFEF